jgi:predicted dithiol-disulfide oxidoreductase (DUF899 family)
MGQARHEVAGRKEHNDANASLLDAEKEARRSLDTRNENNRRKAGFSI